MYQKPIHQSNENIHLKSELLDFLLNRRGPLILFAETDLLKKSRTKHHRNKRIIHHPASLISPPPLKYGELKRSILEYGGAPEVQIMFDMKRKHFNFRINLLMELLMKMEHLSI
jgi:hypothetical protein